MFFEEYSIKSTSEDRFWERIYNFQSAKKSLFEHNFWWMIHNILAHPLLGLFPCKATVRFHDYTSDKLNLIEVRKTWKRYRIEEIKNANSSIPKVINNKWAWIQHNCVSHVKIGFWPNEKTFKEHDQTAEKMNVDGWV